MIEELYQERLKRKKEAKAQGKEAYRAYCEAEKEEKKEIKALKGEEKKQALKQERRIKRRAHRTGRIVRKSAGVAICLVLLLVVNVAVSTFADVITYYIDGADTNYTSADADAAKENGEAIAKEIVSEGVVLLKNQNNLLPLEENVSLNLFGWNSVGWITGGSGSGDSGSSGKISLGEALEGSGFSVNTELLDFYSEYKTDRDKARTGTADFTIYEVPVAEYTDEMIANAKEFSDIAVISIGRVGGEGNDLPSDMSAWGGDSSHHYLELSQDEKDMIDMVCSNFDHVIVLINAANTMELEWVDEYEQIESVLHVGMTGLKGLTALGDILNGTVSPSGKTADTFAYDLSFTCRK